MNGVSRCLFLDNENKGDECELFDDEVVTNNAGDDENEASVSVTPRNVLIRKTKLPEVTCIILCSFVIIAIFVSFQSVVTHTYRLYVHSCVVVFCF
mmetsp:Transcript_3202/g.4860  ORF Transcript_3202/g.4860 Transcript_3202/m.4860 type:complete len:96 (+) Transcript_3202:405-692(+)